MARRAVGSQRPPVTIEKKRPKNRGLERIAGDFATAGLEFARQSPIVRAVGCECDRFENESCVWPMTPSWRRIIVGALFFGGTCVAAVAGYMIAGWQFLDAIYMVVITVFGVGYGEAKPLSDPALKVFTMFVIIAGCSSGIYVVGGFVQMVAEGEINRILETRRMSKGIDKLTGHAIVCGFGRVGQVLADNLAAADIAFVVIDTSEARVARAQAAGYIALLGNASEEETLEAAGIARARVLATVLPDDTSNVFITLTARDMNATIEIVSRAESQATEKKLLRSGANRIVMPALIGASKIAHSIIRPSAEDMLLSTVGKNHLNEELGAIGLQFSEIEVQANSPLVGQTLNDVEIAGGGFVVVAVRRPDNSIEHNPPMHSTLAAHDKLVILGHAEAIPKVSFRARPRVVTSYRGSR